MSSRKGGGQTDKGYGSHRHAAQESRVRKGPVKQFEDSKGGERRDEWWRLTGGCKVQMDGRSAPEKVGV